MTWWQTTHVAVHATIFLGYVMAMALVPRILDGLMRINLMTQVCGAGFFVTCGITHMGLALGAEDSWVVAINDHAQAAFILLFVAGVIHDFSTAVHRLNAAYIALGVKYDEETAGHVIRTVQAALNDRPAP